MYATQHYYVACWVCYMLSATVRKIEPKEFRDSKFKITSDCFLPEPPKSQYTYSQTYQISTNTVSTNTILSQRNFVNANSTSFWTASCQNQQNHSKPPHYTISTSAASTNVIFPLSQMNFVTASSRLRLTASCLNHQNHSTPNHKLPLTQFPITQI